MGFPKYMGVPEQKGAGVSFESKLQQIHFLYPKLGEMYEHYMNLITEFTVKEMERVIDYPDIPIDYSVLIPPFEVILNSLIQSEKKGYQEYGNGYIYQFYEFSNLTTNLYMTALLPYYSENEDGSMTVKYNEHLFSELRGYEDVMYMLYSSLEIIATYFNDFNYLINDFWQYDEMRSMAQYVFNMEGGSVGGNFIYNIGVPAILPYGGEVE